jgi:Caspase domain
MPGSPGTLPALDLPPGKRLALVVSTTTYADPTIRQLRAPARDATDLGELLADPSVGGFLVTSLVDATTQEVRLAMEEFLSERRPDDLLLVYLSCHGLVDARRRLYFAAKDTLKNRLAATGVESQWLLDQLEDCRAKQQVVILDCCFSGAFAQGAKGDTDLGLGERFHGQGRGRVVLTASRASEYSFEGDPVPGSAMPGSVFTSALVAGIRSGAADADNDGWISVDDAYTYAFDQVRATDAEQTPQRWLYGAEGTILLARNPAGVRITPAPLPDDVRAGLESPHPAIRVGAVSTVGEWLSDSDPAKALAARNALEEIAENDVARVATAARELLDGGADRPTTTGQPKPGRATGAQVVDDLPVDGLRKPMPAAHRWSRRRLVWTVAVVAGILGLAGAGVGVLRGGGDTPGKAFVSGSHEITATSPWRLAVVGVTAGCSVTLRSTAGDRVLSAGSIYGTGSYQVNQTGDFRWSVSDPGCAVSPQRGTGDLGAMPFSINWRGRSGDTDSFPVTGPLAVTVTDYHGSSNCTLDLYDAATGQDKTTKTLDTATNSARLDPLNASRVYFHDLQCDLEVRSG